MRAISTNKAFTLVELLIVIAIIGMLSVLSIAGYSDYRKNALLDFSVETVIAKMNEMKESANYGVDGVDSTPKCFGVYFESNASGDFDMKSFTQEYNAERKIWDSNVKKWVYEGCGKQPGTISSADLKEFTFDKMMRVTGVKIEGTPVSDKLYLRFSPPTGNVDVSANGSDFSSVKNVEAKLQYGDGAQAKYGRTLKVDIENSSISYTNP